MKSLRSILCGILIISLFIMTGCSKESEAASAFAPLEENKLIVYTSHKEEVYGPIIKEFEERTGIWVEVKSGGTNELLGLIASEAEFGSCDVMFGGGVDALDAYSEFFTPYICSEHELIGSNYSSDNDSWTSFSSLPIVIIYNNKLVYSDAVPHGWADLIDERWKGKIAFADPNNSGTSYTSLATMLQVLGYEDWSVQRSFVDILNGDILSSSGDVPTAVVAGTKLIGVTLEEAALKRIAQGDDITIVYPEEGTSAVPDGSAIVKNAPHEENAKLFMDFIVSRDVQQLIVDSFCRRSVRTDVELSDNLSSSISLIDYNLAWASNMQKEILSHWSEYTGESR